MKKFLSIFLAALLALSCMPLVLAEEAPIGYATVSITDNGDREALMDMFGLDEDEIEYAEPFGVIVPATQVPVYAGESAAQVLIRLLEMNEITYNATGEAELYGGFYLQNISFTKDGETVENFGECSITPDDDWAKYMSGWMVKVNNCFGSGLSYIEADDEDLIEVLYTCTMGADVGNDFSNPSAAFSALTVSTGELSPAYSTDVKAYTLTVDADVDAVKIDYEAENYGTAVTFTVGETAYKYMRDIPVENGTVIKVSSIFTAYDNTTYEPYTADEDEITITVVKPTAEEPSTETPAAEEPAAEKTFLDKIKDAFNRIIEFFKQIFARIKEMISK